MKDKMNILSIDQRAKILACLVEGCSMRSTQRLTGAAKKTVERLLVASGTACAKYHDEHVRNLTCANVQVDEIWSFIGAKQIHTPEPLRNTGFRGDIWTYTALDADTKLIFSYLTGSRGTTESLQFMTDIKDRLASRTQWACDGQKCYGNTVTLVPNIQSKVIPGSTVFTDELLSYVRLAKRGFNHDTVRHGIKEFVRGSVHTNNIESFWAQFKRSVHGTFHHVSRKHCQKYLNEFAYRHNHRRNVDPIFSQLISIAGEQRSAAV